MNKKRAKNITVEFADQEIEKINDFIKSYNDNLVFGKKKMSKSSLIKKGISIIISKQIN